MEVLGFWGKSAGGETNFYLTWVKLQMNEGVTTTNP